MSDTREALIVAVQRLLDAERGLGPSSHAVAITNLRSALAAASQEAAPVAGADAAKAVEVAWDFYEYKRTYRPEDLPEARRRVEAAIRGTEASETPGLDAATVAEWLHDLDGTQHYVTHETSYDGDDMEGVECVTGVEGHMDDARDLLALLADREPPQ